MQFHREELESAQRYSGSSTFDELTPDQLRLITEHGRVLRKWFKEHKYLHFAISLSVILFLLIGDYFLLLRLPAFLLPADGGGDARLKLLAALIVGSAHSLVIYSLVVYSIHEGAAHDLIFPPWVPLSYPLSRFAANLCRIGSADPKYYAENHLAHHAKFGTAEDREFLNFVTGRRYWLTFFPFGIFFSATDFIVHRPITITRSRVVSFLCAIVYHLAYGTMMARSYGRLFTYVSLLLVAPHVGFYFDRLRQFTEHHLMPLVNKDGARSFGLGFWGLLVGGGPWGQPCHWLHHLVPSVPWYQQVALHFYVRKILTASQRAQFLLQPVLGFPKLVLRIWKEQKMLASRNETLIGSG